MDTKTWGVSLGLFLAALSATPSVSARVAPATPAAAQIGAPVSYQLPADGALPKTYRVTLAITDPKDPDWIISQFVCGAPRTVTKENNGRFTDVWDGLDDNFMPMPPGTYGVKGICMPAEKWEVDNEYHTIVPQLFTGISPWMPRPENWKDPSLLYTSDPSYPTPLMDVDVGPNGVGVFYYQYLEAIANNFQADLKKPVGYGQLIRAHGSVGGGDATCTDGETVWSFGHSAAGASFVYRADYKPFGSNNPSMRGVTVVEGMVKAMAAYRDEAAGRSYVYVAEDAKFVKNPKPGFPEYIESDKEFVNKILVLDGADGKKLGEIPVQHPLGMVARYGTLYVLHPDNAGKWIVSKAALENGLPGSLQQIFAVPATISPFDLEQDSRGRFYLSDPKANKVYQLDGKGKITRTFGRLDRQKPGKKYDPKTFMTPGKLACWKDKDGVDRLLVVDQAGPNGVSEWTADGKLLRVIPSLQTHANNCGYAIDPEKPEHLYIGGSQGSLLRFKIDYAKGNCEIDAVWPELGNEPLLSPIFDRPKVVNYKGKKFLGCYDHTKSCYLYRQDGDRWILSSAFFRRPDKGQTSFNNYQKQWFPWHDANGDGKIQEEEISKTCIQLPQFLVMACFGDQWMDDLSFLTVHLYGRDIWRLVPTEFDSHGNPVFTKIEKVLTDPIFEARANNTADAIHGGNEQDNKFEEAWAAARGNFADGFYVNARAGYLYSANESGQYKISRYVPDGKGGYRNKWRTGRAAAGNMAQPGEIVGSIFLEPPINGLLSVIDNSRSGVLLFTDDGMYVESLFPQRPPSEVGIYKQPGEFFQGHVWPNKNDGNIYIGMGKATPIVYKALGWTMKDNPVKQITDIQKSVSIAASQIASPPEKAMAMRRKAGVLRIARFMPATGGANLDGSLEGWETCDPLQFQADKDQTVEVRCLYDPQNIYLRWHARLAGKYEPKTLEPADQIFSHARAADTLSFYVQGDQNAKPGPAEGRPGDVRIVFGIFQNGNDAQPAALGMYPAWQGKETPAPKLYQSPVGKTEFAHVGLLAKAKLKHVVDDDGKGFVLVAAIPLGAIPGLPPLSSSVRTMVNFEATFQGHTKFWWANADGSANRETYDEPSEARLYPGSWAPAQFQGLDKGFVVRTWRICGPFGGPGAEKFSSGLFGKVPGSDKGWWELMRDFCEAAKYPPDSGSVSLDDVFKPPMISGYWPNPGELRWKQAKLEELNTRVVLGDVAQTWYGVTWVWAPSDLELEFQFQRHPQSFCHWFLNNQKVLEGTMMGPNDKYEVNKTLTLRKGWNQIMFRGYCVGCAPLKAGLVFAGPPEKLWKLRFSSTPQK